MNNALNEQLWHAAATGDTRAAAEAILAGAKLEHKAMYNAVSPDANPWNPSGGRLTPLGVAAYHGHTEMVRLLLNHGADPTVTNDWGQELLRFAKGAEVGLLIQEAVRARKDTKDSSLYLSPKAMPNSPPAAAPPALLITPTTPEVIAEPPRRVAAATHAGGNLSPRAAHRGASPLRVSAQGSLTPPRSPSGTGNKSGSSPKKRRAALETSSMGDEKAWSPHAIERYAILVGC